MMRSKKNLASMIILLICAIIIGCANAEIEIDVYQYSYEELLEIRQRYLSDHQPQRRLLRLVAFIVVFLFFHTFLETAYYTIF